MTGVGPGPLSHLTSLYGGVWSSLERVLANCGGDGPALPRDLGRFSWAGAAGKGGCESAPPVDRGQDKRYSARPATPGAQVTLSLQTNSDSVVYTLGLLIGKGPSWSQDPVSHCSRHSTSRASSPLSSLSLRGEVQGLLRKDRTFRGNGGIWKGWGCLKTNTGAPGMQGMCLVDQNLLGLWSPKPVT